MGYMSEFFSQFDLFSHHFFQKSDGGGFSMVGSSRLTSNNKSLLQRENVLFRGSFVISYLFSIELTGAQT